VTILSGASIARDVQAGQQDAVAVAEACLARIATGNSAINALVRLDSDWVHAQARAVQTRVRAGERLPLAGVPLIVKDNIWVGGRNISQGSRLFENFTAPTDAIAVERARAAGAVIVGIGNSPEFACKGQTNSPLHATHLI
jgi:aspartyl-tRNA(Asn)/glutamyl-tRNA(Gln) amidotransferase subunit A